MKDRTTCTVFHALQCVYVKDVARKLKDAGTLHGVSDVAHNNMYMLVSRSATLQLHGLYMTFLI